MASYDVMNREDGDADHVAVTQSDMTRAAPAALQAYHTPVMPGSSTVWSPMSVSAALR